MCGATSLMKTIGGEQSQFFTTLMQQAQTVFGNASSVFQDLKNTFSPILAAGPNQEGFSGAEKTALNSQVTEGTANTYAKASTALSEQQAAKGGGNSSIPSGADQQQKEQLAASAAASESGQKLAVEQADYEQGRQNWVTAAQGLSGATSVFNPATGAAGAATQGGGAAASTANDISQADNSWANAAFGALGQVGGAVVSGGMSNLGKGKGFFGG